MHIVTSRWFLSAALAVVLALPGALRAETPEAILDSLDRPQNLLGIKSDPMDLNAEAVSRYALVIGNGTYANAPDLPNAISDARLFASLLERAGYVVEAHENLDRRGFETALRRLISDTRDGAEVVIYYAGHGVQVGGSNRLIPVDARLSTAYDLPFETVSLSSILAIAGARSRSLIVVLDSCRDNPFPGHAEILGLESVPQSLQNGFATQDSPLNSLVIFSTSPGARALDGEGANSPFTEALAAAIEAAPDAPIDDLMKDVRRRVYTATGGLQIPWESSSMVEVVHFDGEPEIPGFSNSVAALEPPKSLDAEPMTLTFSLDRRIPVGEALLRGADAGSLMITRQPRYGRLELNAGGKTRGLALLAPSVAGAGGLVYATSGMQIGRDMVAGQVIDNFEVRVDDRLQQVQLTLEADPCDVEAGDLLDPEGVGEGVYPNEIDPSRALPACQAAVERDPDQGRFHYQLGRVHLAMRNLDQAEREFSRARDLDYTRAWHALGLLEINKAQATGGAGRRLAPDKALALLSIGVEKGDPYAYHSLGIQLLENSEDPDLKRRGYDLLGRSLEVGHTFSMNGLGLYFLDKNSDHYDPNRGLRYLRESAARGDIYGYENMGYVLRSGAGDQQPDPQGALEMFKRASDGGHPTAPTSIGRLYNWGDLGRADPAEAVKWYDLGLSRGDGWGGANAAWLIAKGRVAGYGPGDAAARAAKAAVLANPEPAAAANEVLDSLSASALDAGVQVLMTELGEPVVADGAFGAASRAALDRLAARFGVEMPGDRRARLKKLATLYWTEHKFRVDLY